MGYPKYFLNHRCIHAPSSHVRLCLSLSILPFESLKVADHFHMHYILENEAHKIAFCSVFAGSTVFLSLAIFHYKDLYFQFNYNSKEDINL